MMHKQKSTLYIIRHTFVQVVWRLISLIDDKWAAKTHLPTGVTREVDIPYTEGEMEEQCLDIYFPEKMGERLPMILYIHGGGFISGDKKHTQQYAMTLAKEGYLVFNVNYRLAPKYKNPSQILDIFTALSWIKKHCEEYDGDPDRLFIAGDSAGAYLSALTALLCTDEKMKERFGIKPSFEGEALRGVILLSGLYDLETGTTRSFPSIKSDIEMFLGVGDIVEYKNIEHLSVLKNITENFPPVFLSSGEVDGLYPETIALIQVLKKKKIPRRALLFDKGEKEGFHGYQKHLRLRTARLCMKAVKEFLRAYR